MSTGERQHPSRDGQERSQEGRCLPEGDEWEWTAVPSPERVRFRASTSPRRTEGMTGLGTAGSEP